MTLAVDSKKLHPATQAALIAMEKLSVIVKPAKILDLGCGNGILAVTAAHMWPNSRIIAADISPNAVADAQKAVAEHAFSERIEIVRSEGFSNPRLKQTGPYELMIANLLAETLIELSGEFKNIINPGCYGITSGILLWLAKEIELAYKALNIEIIEEISILSWRAYILCMPVT